MNWKYRYRYAAMDKDTFFCGDGIMKVGDEFHPVEHDYREDYESNDGVVHIKQRGGSIKLPNGHSVSIAWGTNTYGDNFMHYAPRDGKIVETREFNEIPRQAEVAIITPDGKDFIDLDIPHYRPQSHVYGNQTTEQAKELIRRAKEL